MISKLRRPIALLIAIYLCCFIASPALAEMMGETASDAGQARSAELVRIKRALEAEIVKENLGALGLTPQEINQRLEGLSDEQLHTLVQASNRVLAGGEGGKVGITVLLIILIVVSIMYIMLRKIIIK